MLDKLKIDLGITTDAYNERLSDYLRGAHSMIETEGVTLTDSDQDQSLIIMYAAWMWRKRDSMEGMPRMLRWTLNNRIMQEKMQ